ncbi:MAG: amidohydrolase family protein [Clostridiales bacterium]|nr:amidohydrolase family protein [Clostridiales bacterium]
MAFVTQGFCTPPNRSLGLAKGIFMVDTHTHGQRHAYGFQSKGEKPDYATLADGMSLHAVVYSNAPRMLYHMDRYDIDVSVLLPAFGMTNEINLEIVKEHPDRFVAFALDVQTNHAALRGEKVTVKDSLEELERLLDTGMFKGIGEGMPDDGEDWNERFESICKSMELCKKYKVVAQYHTGTPSGYAGGDLAKVQGHYEIPHANPMLCHAVASEFPDVPIIMCHAGIEGGGYYLEYYEKCLNVAASHDNVYLECGQWWAELYERPLKDPNIGVDKLIFGTDWGASCTPQSWMPGCVPETYVNQDISLGPPSHQCDIWGWALRELGRLNIPQDDLNLILGGNAVRLLGIKTPHTRLFKEYLNKRPRLWYQDEVKK